MATAGSMIRKCVGPASAPWTVAQVDDFDGDGCSDDLLHKAASGDLGVKPIAGRDRVVGIHRRAVARMVGEAVMNRLRTGDTLHRAQVGTDGTRDAAASLDMRHPP